MSLDSVMEYIYFIIYLFEIASFSRYYSREMYFFSFNAIYICTILHVNDHVLLSQNSYFYVLL